MRATIIDSSASSGVVLNSVICSRAVNTASMRRRLLSGVVRRASSSTSGRSSSLTSSPRAPVCTAMETAVHLEYFHDHARIERMLFEGVPEPRDGVLYPDLTAPGHGLELRSHAGRHAQG